MKLDHRSGAAILKQLPALRMHQELKATDLHTIKKAKTSSEKYQQVKSSLLCDLKEFFLENSITGYFVEFCIDIDLPFSLDENRTWDGEWFYFPEFNLEKIEQNLNNWAEAKRSEWLRRYTRSGLFSILHAPSLLTVSDYAVTESSFISALKNPT